MDIQASSIYDLRAEVTLSMLSTTMTDVADIIGLDNAIKLIDLGGGTRLNIPKKPTNSHIISLSIGYGNFVKLCYYYDGSYIDIQSSSSIRNSVRKSRIIIDLLNGVSNRDIAIRYGVSMRYAWKIKAELVKNNIVSLK